MPLSFLRRLFADPPPARPQADTASVEAQALRPVIRLGAAAVVRLPLPPGPVRLTALASSASGRRAMERQRGFDRAMAMARLDPLPQQGDLVYVLAARMAAHACAVPLAAVTVLDDTTQWMLGSVGGSTAYTPLELSFCRHALAAGDAITVIPDTRADPRVAAHPLVMAGPCLRFYAGAPMFDSDGVMVGTVCVADVRPRQLTPGQAMTLQYVAASVMRLLQLRAPVADHQSLPERRRNAT